MAIDPPEMSFMLLTSELPSMLHVLGRVDTYLVQRTIAARVTTAK